MPILALGLWAWVLLSSPYLHHDVACHLTSRTHCTTCGFNLSRLDAGSEPLPFAMLPDAGEAPLRVPPVSSRVIVIHPSDRSPPTA